MAGVLDNTTVEPRKRAALSSRKRAVGLTILWHSDIARIGEVAVLSASAQPFAARLSRIEPTFVRPGVASANPYALAEACVSRRPIGIELGSDGVVSLSCESTSTSVVANGTPVRGTARFHLDDVEAGVVIELAERVVVLLHRLGHVDGSAQKYGLVGDSEAICRVRQDISRVAGAPVPVLIRGETGTGKELVARAIHAASGRANRPCVCVNMATLVRETARSELFGHVKGAFTGAVRDHAGFFRDADGGTLFLDEIGETPVDVQTMLLRVLETGEVTPVGGRDTHNVDVRLISATDAALADAVEAGQFREPLLHRLSGYQIVIPPLRQRRDDIGRLLSRFVREQLAKLGELDRLDPRPPEELPWMPTSVVAELARFSWPGNVRQLNNVAQQLVVSSRGLPQVELSASFDFVREQAPPATTADAAPEPPRPDVDTAKPAHQITEDDLIAALRANEWRPGAAATALGVSRTTVHALIGRSSRIRKARDLSEHDITRARETHGDDLVAAAAHLEVSKRALMLRMRELKLD